MTGSLIALVYPATLLSPVNNDNACAQLCLALVLFLFILVVNEDLNFNIWEKMEMIGNKSTFLNLKHWKSQFLSLSEDFI